MSSLANSIGRSAGDRSGRLDQTVCGDALRALWFAYVLALDLNVSAERHAAVWAYACPNLRLRLADAGRTPPGLARDDDQAHQLRVWQPVAEGLRLRPSVRTLPRRSESGWKTQLPYILPKWAGLEVLTLIVDLDANPSEHEAIE